MPSKTISNSEDMDVARSAVETKLQEFENNIDLLSDRVEATTRSVSKWVSLIQPIKWAIAALAAASVVYLSFQKISPKSRR